MGGRHRADIQADMLLPVSSTLVALDVSAGIRTHFDPVNDPHGCHSDAAQLNLFCLFFFFFPQTVSISLQQQCRLQTWVLRRQELPELLPVCFALYTSGILPCSVLQTGSAQLIITYSIRPWSCCSICNTRSFCEGHITHDISHWELAFAVY